MNLFTSYLDGAYMAFLASPVNCCMPRKENVPRPGAEKPTTIDRQPRAITPPLSELQERPSTAGREWLTRTKSIASRASSRRSFAVKRKMNANNGSRRPRIGPPADFRHVGSASARRASWSGDFRPLVLSIHVPANKLSPILPYFGDISDAPLPSRYSREMLGQPAALIHSTGESAVSVQDPQKPVRSGSGTSWESTAQCKSRPDSFRTQDFLAVLENHIPIAPPSARLRANTEPVAYERVQTALHEKYKLEQRVKSLEETIEKRRSVYLNNRLSASHVSSRAASIYSVSQEPMPSPISFTHFHITPAAAPSHAQQTLSPLVQRPATAPLKRGHTLSESLPWTEASATFTTPSHSPASTASTRPSSQPSSRPEYSILPPPPLPLVLQQTSPVLGRKKSFSRVSSWLFPSSGEHTRDISLDSVTNNPRPVTIHDGFYQCFIQPSKHVGSSSLSTFSTLESESELTEPMFPVTGSPNLSAIGKHKQEITIRRFSADSDRNHKSIGITQDGKFREETDVGEVWKIGSISNVGERDHVGVAF
ncbi:hypothetical protein BUE80_DR008076 [Diplocarpon rosae]|nr:hypothetical protein BUE80_DR008076 [Diplocarpon rosae]